MLNFFKLMFSALGKFLLEIFNASKADIISKLKDVAVKAVTELANTDLSNEQKRNEAFARIKQFAILNGIQAKDSLINLAIELAIQKLKG